MGIREHTKYLFTTKKGKYLEEQYRAEIIAT